MQEMWQQLVGWFFSLGAKYGVDPIIFGTIYVGAIPLFTLSVAWLVKSKRAGSPIVWPVVSTGFWFISSYLYLFVAGENIPWWVYVIVISLLAYGAYASYRKIQSRLEDA